MSQPSPDSGQTADTLLNGRVHLAQPREGYRAAIDPVFLAAACPARAAETVLDVGCGVGAAALCLAARLKQVRLTGIEMQETLAQLARHNGEANGWAERMTILHGDLSQSSLPPGGFDHVITNPPFLDPAEATPPPDESKRAAHVEGSADLRRWMGFCTTMLRHKGSLTIIHRADRLDDLLAALAGRIGAIEIIPLWPKAGRPAKRVLLRGRKGLRSPLSLTAGMVLHQEDGAFTPQAQAVLRDGAALS